MKTTTATEAVQTEPEAVAEEPIAPVPEAEAEVVEAEVVEAEAEAVLAYRCPAHAEYFPNEDPVRPYTEFKVDPYTLKRVHDRACLQCVRARRNGQQDLPPIERVRIAQKQVGRELDQLRARGQGKSEEAASASWHLKYLNQQLSDLLQQDGVGHE
jgi:hypothetical protein